MTNSIESSTTSAPVITELAPTFNDTMKAFALEYSDWRVPTVDDLDTFNQLNSQIQYDQTQKSYLGPDGSTLNKALAQRVRVFSAYQWELSDSDQQALEQHLQAIEADTHMTAANKLGALKTMGVPVDKLPTHDEAQSAAYWVDQVNNLAVLSKELRQKRSEQQEPATTSTSLDEANDFDAHVEQALGVVAGDTKHKAKQSQSKRLKRFSAAAIAAYNKPFDALTAHIIEKPKAEKPKKKNVFDRLTSHIIEHPKTDETSTTPTPKTSEKSKSGVKAAYATIGAAAMMGVDRATTKSNEYFGHEEKGEKRRRGAKILGAAALFGGGLLVGYLIAKGMYSGSSNSAQVNPEVVPSVPGQKVNDAATVVSGGVVTRPPSHESVQGVHEVLHKGETIWGDSSQYLKTTPYGNSQSNIMKVTQWVLHNQHLSWNDARHLPVGYHFNMPPQAVLDELLKSK